MSKSASINVDGEFIVVIAPHHDDFAPRAHALGGEWNGVAFVFETAALHEVEALCFDLFDAVEVHEAELGDPLANTSLDDDQEEEPTVPYLDASGEDPCRADTVMQLRNADMVFDGDGASDPTINILTPSGARPADTPEFFDDEEATVNVKRSARPKVKLTKEAIQREIDRLEQRIAQLKSLLGDD